MAVLGSPGPVVSVLRTVGPALVTDPLMVRFINIAHSTHVFLNKYETLSVSGCHRPQLALLFTSARSRQRSVSPFLEVATQIEKVAAKFFFSRCTTWYLCERFKKINQISTWFDVDFYFAIRYKKLIQILDNSFITNGICISNKLVTRDFVAL